MVWDVFWEFPAFGGSHRPREDIPPLTPDQSEKLIVFRKLQISLVSVIKASNVNDRRKGISGSASHPTEKGDAFSTPGRRQCTQKYIMVWDVFWEFPAFGGSHRPREDIPPLTPDQSEKLIVFRKRILSRIHNGRHPSYCTIASAVQRLHKTRSCHIDVFLYLVPHLQHILAEDVLGYALAHPESSVRDISKACSYSKLTAWNILHTYGTYPYCPVLAQELMPGDQDRRFDFCNVVLSTLDENSDFLNVVG
ncbi:DUF4817 domain-containing protein [Trichonephila clavipes]|nr:DUF4817 domain-containing protein [Trichonephila clavipes]